MSQGPEEDDERTIVRPSSGRSGPGAPGAQLGHQLPIGTRVRDYEITSLIGEGGFGIVYLAYDHSLERHVAIKEYMPSSMASRVNGTATVVVKSERHQETFKAGLKSFVNEARLLARFDHPALVKVYRFWEEHGTAYMVMPYYEGPTLKSALAARGSVPDEAALRAWLRPLLDALGVMHAAQCYHRDIAPDNILLTQGGPLLLDFGAARRVIGDMTHALTVVLKPGYAPIEQYGDVATMTQGAWTDLYALACVVYFAITGKVPMSSVERLMDDRLEPLSRLAAGRYTPAFLAAIDAALAVRPQDRPQTDAQFRELLDGPGAAPLRSGFGQLTSPEDPVTRIVANPRTAPPTATTRSTHAPPSMQTAASTRVPTVAPRPPATFIGAPPVTTSDHEATTAPGLAPGPVAAPMSAPEAATVDGLATAPRASANRLPIYLAAAAVGIAAAVAAALYFAGDRTPASTPSPSIAAAPTPAREPASAVAPPGPPPTVAETASAPPAAVVEAPPAPTPTAAAIPTPAPAAPAPTPAVEQPRTTPSETAQAPPRQRTRRDASTETPAARPAEAARETATTPPPSRTGVTQSRCSDILQKASLEPLNAEEAAFLKRECR